MPQRNAGSEVVVVEAVRTPMGRRGGGLSGVHPADLLGGVLREALGRVQLDPGEVGQVVGGCIDQMGEQGVNVTRTAWLSAGLPERVAATTIDSQCGSSQQATSLAIALVGAGVVDVAVGCGVESMSRVPILCTIASGPGHPAPKSWFHRYEGFPSQFEAGERVARRWDVTREQADELGLRSQERALAAWAEHRFDAQIAPVTVPGEGGDVRRIERDECPRETSLEALAGLAPIAGGIHTAGTASKIADAAAALVVTTSEKARDLGLRARARIVDTCLVGSDPVLMLAGPIDATRHLLSRNAMTLADVDVVEINEAFASVVLAWARELGADLSRVNPNGGAIALGHPLGATGAILLTKAVHELERTGKAIALVTICCGGGLATATLLERV